MPIATSQNGRVIAGGAPPDLDEHEKLDACQLIALLRQTTIGNIDRIAQDRHFTIHDGRDGWRCSLREIHALSSRKQRVIVFSAWGTAASFYDWAAMYHPGLYDLIKQVCDDDSIIVVVPAVARYGL